MLSLSSSVMGWCSRPRAVQCRAWRRPLHANQLEAAGGDTLKAAKSFGAHVSRRIPFPKWVPGDVMKAAETLSTQEAERILSAELAGKKSKAATRRSAKIVQRLRRINE